MSRGLIILFALVAWAGCTNKLSGELVIDGETFELDGCRSGQVYGFSGVELRGTSGARLRLVQTPTGQGRAILMAAGAADGVDLGECGPFSVSQQNSTINDVKNVEGAATLSCTGAGHTVKGTVAFANCH